MPLIFTIVLLAVPFAALSLFFKKRMYEIMPLVFFVVIAMGYVLSLFGVLKLLVYICQISWALSAGYIIYHIFKRKEFSVKSLVWDISILTAMLIFFWWISRGRYFESWDEFSHWGKALKGMYNSDMLYCMANSTHIFNEYPPGISILQYAVLKIMNFGFREDIAMFIQAIFYSSLIVYPANFFKHKISFFNIVSMGILLICPLTLFPSFYHYLLIDAGIGTVFAFILLCSFLQKPSALKSCNIAFACFVLSIMKASGTAFAVIALVVVVANEAFTKHPIDKKLIIYSSFATIFGKLSWSIFLKVNSVNLRWQASDLSVNSILSLFNGTAPEYRRQTITNFFGDIIGNPLYGNIVNFSYIQWGIVFLLLAILLVALTPRDNRKKIAISFAIVMSGGIIYTLSVLFAYLFTFDPVEAVMLASISRYLNTMLVGIIIFFISFILYAFSQKGTAAKAICAVGCTVILFLIASPSLKPVIKNIINAPLKAAQTANYRSQFSKAADKIKAIGTGEDIALYLISQNDMGLAQMVIEYELDPIKLPEQYTSIGTPYDDQDIWTKNYTQKEFEQLLYEKFDYIYLYNVDNKFATEYEELFGSEKLITNGNIFKIEKQSDKKVKFVKVDI